MKEPTSVITPYLTQKQLAQAGACKPALVYFRQRFGSMVAITPEMIDAVCIDDNHDDLVQWLIDRTQINDKLSGHQLMMAYYGVWSKWRDDEVICDIFWRDESEWLRDMFVKSTGYAIAALAKVVIASPDARWINLNLMPEPEAL